MSQLGPEAAGNSSSEAKEDKKEASDVVEGMSRARLNRLDAWMERYVSSGKLAMAGVCVTRNDQTLFLGCKGSMDLEQKRPVQLDTIYRIYSMTKAVVTVAAMMLWEEGHFALNDPISNLLPQFKNTRVYVKGGVEDMETVPANKPITFRHLMSHTSGLTYHFFNANPVDELYRKHDIDFLSPQRTSLKDLVDKLAQQPLVSHPGERWNYGVSVDVLGYLVEIMSGVPLAQFLQKKIFEPLGMVDTSFTVPQDKAHRLASCYMPYFRDGRFGTLLLDPPGPPALHVPCTKGNHCPDPNCLQSHPDKRPKPQAVQEKLAAGQFGPSAFLDPLGATVPSGGGGLCSTLQDYSLFLRMLTNGGELNGVRLLGPRTIDLMASNHMPNNQDLEQCGNKLFAETNYDGVGFGLGFAVVIDQIKAGTVTKNCLHWGGLAGTCYFLDLQARVACVFMTQLVPSSTYAELRRNLHTLVFTSVVSE